MTSLQCSHIYAWCSINVSMYRPGREDHILLHSSSNNVILMNDSITHGIARSSAYENLWRHTGAPDSGEWNTHEIDNSIYRIFVDDFISCYWIYWIVLPIFLRVAYRYWGNRVIDFTLLCHLSTVPEYILMLTSLFGHILKLVIRVPFLPIIFTYLIAYDLQKYHSC